MDAVNPRIEDYALLGDRRSAALVSLTGSIDWLCLPRFDSPACLAALLGTADNGRWSIAPTVPHDSQRRYRPGTMVLETTHRCDTGTIVVTDALDVGDGQHRLVRLIEGLDGSVPVRMELLVRFDYGSVVPWVSDGAGGLHLVAGPDALVLRTPLDLRREGGLTVAEADVDAGARVGVELAWHQSHGEPPGAADPAEVIDATTRWWTDWSDRIAYEGAYRDDVRRSLLVLKALTHEQTGAIVAAPTTSLPEWIGGQRNWDYRYCWLRDATLTLLALLQAGCTGEATAWRDWLIRAVAGDPAQLQIMYGIGGERRLPELELDWLEGFASSRPVRVGNSAVDQVQIDVFGEVMDALDEARASGIEPDPLAWAIQREMLAWLEDNWDQPDEGIWEVRSGRAHFTHSKVMAWVAFDRAVRAVERDGLDGDARRWRTIADQIHAQVCARGVDERGVFTQAYGSSALDAAALAIPLVGFLPADDPRVVATVEAIQRELTDHGLVRRYLVDELADDGVGGEEGTFLLYSFWLVDCLALMGRHDEATQLFEQLLSLRNDVGLLAEQYDPRGGRQLGNFPQAFSHIALASSAITLCPAHTGPSEHRASAGGGPPLR